MRDITLRWFVEDEFVYTDTLNDYDFDCFINIENGEICLFCEAGDDDFTGIRYEKADNKTREQFTGMTRLFGQWPDALQFYQRSGRLLRLAPRADICSGANPGLAQQTFS